MTFPSDKATSLRPICYDCKRPINGIVVWLGETDEATGQPFELPFHQTCANQPWPLYEIRRDAT